MLNFMKSWKSVVLVISLVSLMAYAFWPVEGTIKYIENKINNIVPTKILVESIGKDIQNAQKEINSYEIKIRKLAEEKTRVKNSYSKAMEEKVQKDKELKIIENLLEKNQNTYMIGQIEYSKKDIENDALVKLEYYKNLNEKIITLKTLLSTFEKGHQQCKDNLMKYKKHIQTSKMQLTILKAKETNIELCQKIQDRYNIDGLATIDMTSLNKNLLLYQNKIENQEILLQGYSEQNEGIEYIPSPKVNVIESIKNR